MESTHLVMILSVLVAIFLVLLVLVGSVRHQQKKQKRAQGITGLQVLRSMLMHIQRHRGLSTAVLGGDTVLLAELEATQNHITRDLGHIALVGQWIKDNPDWQAITAHWARLAGRYPHLNISQNLDQHTKLIKSVLVFIDEVAITLYLQAPRQEHKLQVQTSWRYLLDLTEALGQLRAVGLAYITSLERGEHAPRLRNILQVQLAQFMLNINSDDFKRFTAKAQQDEIHQFIARFPEALLKDPQSCPIKSYYQSATGVMDALYMQFDNELQRLQATP